MRWVCAARSSTLSWVAENRVSTSPARRVSNGAIASDAAASQAAAIAVVSTANGMILTVAMMSPAHTGESAGIVATVIASSITLTRPTESRSTTNTLAANHISVFYETV